ncbi:MAG: SAF domain-containing protein [Actinomycetota bacterium]|nr:SAF domain-containing protein [Actinomycetota bacterium]
MRSLLPRRGPRAPVSRHRLWRRALLMRLVSATLAGLAVWFVVAPLLPRSAEVGVEIVVTTRDLPIGATLAPGDVTVELRPPGHVPTGAVHRSSDAVGRVTSGPVLGGELVTTARFRGPARLGALPAGLLAVSVPVVDTGLMRDLRPSDVVTLFAPGSGETVAELATVLSVTGDGTGTDGTDGAGLLGGSSTNAPRLVVALSAQEARSVAIALGPAGAGAGTTSGFVLGLRP